MNSIALPTVLKIFAELFSPKALRQWTKAKEPNPDSDHPRGFYQRIFSPVVTLWYLIFQRLNSDKTQDAVVKDLRAGGADRLSPSRRQPLSKKVRSDATTSYNDARQRIPLNFLQWVLQRIAHHIQALRPAIDGGRNFQLLDGSTLAVLVNRALGKVYPPSKNQHGRSDWSLIRVVVGFCLSTGVVLSAAEGSIHLSEQALTWTLMARALAGTVWIADRNFGVWSVVAQAILCHQDAIVRLTQSRAGRLTGGRTWVSGQEEVVQWRRTKHDKIAPGTEEVCVKGRLIFVQVCREGRFINLWLFTTLMDQEAFPVSRLVELYGYRWQVELDFRYVKTVLGMATLVVQSPEMARKEFYAGLIAYDLVRMVMAAAEQPNLPPKSAAAPTLQISSPAAVAAAASPPPPAPPVASPVPAAATASAAPAGTATAPPAIAAPPVTARPASVSTAPVPTLSFSQVRRLLIGWLSDLGEDWRSRKGSLAEKLEQLIATAARQKLPARRKTRQSEPRRVRRRIAKFPALKGSRQAARDQMKLSA
jgi:hypothetical protein